jgi:hypothetical protein
VVVAVDCYRDADDTEHGNIRLRVTVGDDAASADAQPASQLFDDPRFVVEREDAGGVERFGEWHGREPRADRLVKSVREPTVHEESGDMLTTTATSRCEWMSLTVRRMPPIFGAASKARVRSSSESCIQPRCSAADNPRRNDDRQLGRVAGSAVAEHVDHVTVWVADEAAANVHGSPLTVHCGKATLPASQM